VDENADVLVTPQIPPSIFYPPKAKEVEELKAQPMIVPIYLAEAAEIAARSERARVYFSSTCPSGEHLKKIPKEEAGITTSGLGILDDWSHTRETRGRLNGCLKDRYDEPEREE
jgi:hypothetical protein